MLLLLLLLRLPGSALAGHEARGGASSSSAYSFPALGLGIPRAAHNSKMVATRMPVFSVMAGVFPPPRGPAIYRSAPEKSRGLATLHWMFVLSNWDFLKG